MRCHELLTFMVMMSFTHAYCSCIPSKKSSEQEKQNIITSGHDISAKLLQLVYKKDNVIFSPFNIRLAMALLHLGAAGNTRKQIAHFLGFSEDEDRNRQSHEILKQILQDMENSTVVQDFDGEDYDHEESSSFKISDILNANGVFVQKGIEILQNYQSFVQSYYKGEATNVDFHDHPTNATDIINQFVSKNTQGKISKLLNSPVESQLSILIAACLYFQSSWDEPFKITYTEDGLFDTGFGSTSVKFMHKVEYIPYIDIPSLQIEAVSLNYMENKASMFFVLSYKNQTLEAVVSSLNGNVLKQIVEESSSTSVDLVVPRIKYVWSQDIKELLQKLGVNDVFNDEANLSNFVSNATLKVSQVSHTAQIEINEKGTEASAVTIPKIVLVSGDLPDATPLPFHLNRPFLIFIYHYSTQTILFIGTVHKPNDS